MHPRCQTSSATPDPERTAAAAGGQAAMLVIFSSGCEAQATLISSGGLGGERFCRAVFASLSPAFREGRGGGSRLVRLRAYPRVGPPPRRGSGRAKPVGGAFSPCEPC